MAGLHVVVGLGLSGYACVRFLAAQGVPVAVIDTRTNPPFLAQLRAQYPHVNVVLGQLDQQLLDQAEIIVLSPSIALETPEIAEQVAKGKVVIGEVELFARHVNKPVIAITGTNAKSTVTTLVGLMAQAAGLKTQVGGNLGVPALDLLQPAADVDVYVLELSSFQLETTTSLRPQVAAILNVSPDHLDRYASYADYIKAKLNIYRHAHNRVCNLDDPLTQTGAGSAKNQFGFTLTTPNTAQVFGLLRQATTLFLAHGQTPLLEVKALPILGQHYQANALAALAIGYAFDLPMSAMLKVLTSFNGLAHRCQFVRELHGVRWYNDSKGTNVGATLAAIDGLGNVIDGKVVLIAGGVGKNADFSQLGLAAAKYARCAILIGVAAPAIAQALGGQVKVQYADSMAQAVQLAKEQALANDCVLLSPACASYDMFTNFEHRGEVFMKLVADLSGN